jgi:hypothetical protein
MTLSLEDWDETEFLGVMAHMGLFYWMIDECGMLVE